MTGPSVAVVCTTIGDGSFLKHYAQALEGADARMFVIPDRKTPAALYDAVRAAEREGMRITCPDPITQAQFTLSLGAPDGFFPWDTDHRRNVGYLMAYESGADIVISIDDDNLPIPGLRYNWLGAHEHALTAGSMPAVSSDTGFYNPCEDLGIKNGPVWPRGYPYGKRGEAVTTHELVPCKIAINAGLWIGDPDVDAITRIALHPQSVLPTTGPGPAMLAADTWAPVNSQNTAVRRDVIPAYYFFRSGRFGDIYQGYLAQACAKAMGHSVRFGTPAVRHERNDHDLLRDLQLELPDILLMDGWLDWLTWLKPEGSTCAEAYGWLAGELREHAKFGAVSADAKKTFHSMASQMHQWLTLIRKIGA
jgi:Reversibly glycosylated polypeptide